MPYTPSDAKRFTKKARTPKRQRQWVHTYDSMRARGKSEGASIRAANAAVKRSTRKGLASPFTRPYAGAMRKRRTGGVRRGR